MTDNPNFVPALILLGSAVVPTTVLTYASTGGRRPIGVATPALVWTTLVGGLFGTVLAGTLEYDVRNAPRPWIAAGTATSVLVGVTLLHAAWDSTDHALARIVVAVIGLGALMATIRFQRRHVDVEIAMRFTPTPRRAG